ncbi:MAG: hypothetical protein JJU37_08890 [Balneolaceae bacterium]|nr:hypothetical protein [Balneolaceae bacterium]
MDNLKYSRIYNQILNEVLNNEFYGYDPYDGLNTEYKILSKSKLVRLILVYFNKFSPLNFRKLLKVKESNQLMTMCIVANSMFSHKDVNDNKSNLVEAFDDIWEMMKQTSLKSKYGYHCWDAHNFPIQMRGRYTHGDVASVVGNQIFGEFLINYHKISDNHEVLEYIEDLREFFMIEFYCEKKDVAFFKYKTEKPDTNFTLNASTRAARFVMQSSSYLNCNKYDAEIKKVFDLVINLQKEDGRWNYTHYFSNGWEKKQVDYHQGFILDDIIMYMNVFGEDELFLNSYKNGLEFYKNRQFLENGQGIYRYPKKWPVNIHNQSQGIITFSRAEKFDPKYLEFAKTITDWTIENMYDEKKGYFYYLKYPVFTNKIRYVRWSDANMLLALAHLNKHIKQQ